MAKPHIKLIFRDQIGIFQRPFLIWPPFTEWRKVDQIGIFQHFLLSAQGKTVEVVINARHQPCFQKLFNSTNRTRLLVEQHQVAKSENYQIPSWGNLICQTDAFGVERFLNLRLHAPPDILQISMTPTPPI